MIDFNVADLTIEEKFKIKIMQREYAYIRIKDSTLSTNKFSLSFKIKRFAAEDLYSIYSQYDGNLNINSWDHNGYGHSFVNIINNKIKLEKNFVSGQKDYNLSNGQLLFHHSEIQEKFKNTNYLFSFIKASHWYSQIRNLRFRQKFDPLKKIVSYASFLEFMNILTLHRFNSQSLVKLKFIKNISFLDRTKHFNLKTKKKWRENPQILINFLEQVREISPQISYSNFFIKFNNLNLLKHNSELATIYWQPNDKKDVFNSDFKFKNNSYIKVEKNKYKLIFQKSADLAKNQKKMKQGEVIEVGKLVLPEFTSYDFDKKKITNEVNEFSNRGLLVPFNFKGDFFYHMHIGINEVFKNLDFFIYQKVNARKLDPFEGTIRVEIMDDIFTFDSKNNEQTFVINSNFFKEILDLGELINPLAIIRFSKNEEE